MGFNLTPQKKLISVNQSLGNLAITQQQATSREVYDTESYTATQTFFTFFEKGCVHVHVIRGLT